MLFYLTDHEWEKRVQVFEDEDGDEEDEEPQMWTRIRSLLLCLYLQLHHRLMNLRERVDSVLQMLGAVAETVGTFTKNTRSITMA